MSESRTLCVHHLARQGSVVIVKIIIIIIIIILVSAVCSVVWCTGVLCWCGRGGVEVAGAGLSWTRPSLTVPAAVWQTRVYSRTTAHLTSIEH